MPNQGTTTSVGQVIINGAFAFDNVFMVNGVDINDNLFAQPQNLFIEDAIEETQVLTSGISAEYGRFTGGVINAITKSGGNSYSGSGRVEFPEPVVDDRDAVRRVETASTHLASAVEDLRRDVRRSPHRERSALVLHVRAVMAVRPSRHGHPDRRRRLTVDRIDNDKRGEIKLTGTVGQRADASGRLSQQPARRGRTAPDFQTLPDRSAQ